MNKKILKLIGAVLLFSLFSFAFYPNPEEIIVVFIIGLGFLLAVGWLYKRWYLVLPITKMGSRKLIKWVLQALIIIFAITFLLVVRTSWFENRLVFNIFQTDRGRAYVYLTIVAFVLTLLYFGYFYLKHGRWLENEDFKDKSRPLTPKEIIMVIVIVAVVTFAAFIGWPLYILFSEK